MPKAKETLDDISHEHAPSRWLEEAAAQPRPALQLGTLGGGNHFLEACPCSRSPAARTLLAQCKTASPALTGRLPTHAVGAAETY